MKVNLTPSWTLTTEHSASSYGQPVLVQRTDDRIAYGPGDILQPYPSWGMMPAAQAVQRMAKTAKLDAIGKKLVEAFTGGLP